VEREPLGILDPIGFLRLRVAGLYPVMTLALALLAYGVPTLLHGSGFLAVYIVGLSVGSTPSQHRGHLVAFHVGLAFLAQVTMFVVLGLLVFPSDLPEVMVSGFVLALRLDDPRLRVDTYGGPHVHPPEVTDPAQPTDPPPEWLVRADRPGPRGPRAAGLPTYRGGAGKPAGQARDSRPAAVCASVRCGARRGSGARRRRSRAALAYQVGVDIHADGNAIPPPIPSARAAIPDTPAIRPAPSSISAPAKPTRMPPARPPTGSALASRPLKSGSPGS